MILQLTIGTILMLLTILLAGVCFWLLETWLLRYHRWLTSAPHGLKLFAVLSVVAVWIMAQITAGVWLWALSFLMLGVFDSLEPAVYFALVAFTTLGFGDILLPEEWRLLSGMAAANGLLNFGLLTAVLVETLRQVRLNQREAMSRDR